MTTPSVFQRSTRDGKVLLQITPPVTTNPGTILGNLAYEIVDGEILQTPTGVVLKSTATLRIESVIGIDVVRTIKSTVVGLGSADLIFRDSGGASSFIWHNVPQAEAVRDYIFALKADPAQWQDIALKAGIIQIPKALRVARESHHAGFGKAPTLSQRPTRTITTRIHLAATPDWIAKDVQLIDNGDGTITDHDNQLMWIGAAWGMIWDGNRFAGDAIRLTWIEATELFRRGASWLKRSEEQAVAFTQAERDSTGINFGYVKGTCAVQFAGFEDWRLPTVADWASAFVHSPMLDNPSREPVWPPGPYLTATGCKKYSSLFAHTNPVAWGTGSEQFVDEHSDYRFKVTFVRNLKHHY